MEHNWRVGYYTVYFEDKEGNVSTCFVRGDGKRDAIKKAIAEYANREDNVAKELIPVEARIEEFQEFEVDLSKPEASLF